MSPALRLAHAKKRAYATARQVSATSRTRQTELCVTMETCAARATSVHRAHASEHLQSLAPHQTSANRPECVTKLPELANLATNQTVAFVMTATHVLKLLLVRLAFAWARALYFVIPLGSARTPAHVLRRRDSASTPSAPTAPHAMMEISARSMTAATRVPAFREQRCHAQRAASVKSPGPVTLPRVNASRTSSLMERPATTKSTARDPTSASLVFA